MDEKRRNEAEDSKSAEPRAEWAPPEFCRFEAGAAEFGDSVQADAQPGFS